MEFGQTYPFPPCEPFPKPTDNMATGFSKREQGRNQEIAREVEKGRSHSLQVT